jgi:multicomponent Na+:H+ antiporter subunit E
MWGKASNCHAHYNSSHPEGAAVLRALSLWLALFILWLLLSGYLDLLLLGFGAFSCALAVLLTWRAQVIDPEELHLNEYLRPRLLAYLLWLVREIVKSNIEVARCILDPRLPISPILISLQPSQRNELGQVIYANSITLTPGTITTYLSHGRLEVHALTWEAAAALAEGEMDRRVSTLEKVH